jgi:ribosomal protein S3
MAIASSMRMGAEGIKVSISGRLAGAEMASVRTLQRRKNSFTYIQSRY